MEKDPINVTKEEKEKITPSECMNINIGVLGHVDSGKTSICRILSEITSTASLDKHPQSQERGITLDLGFSAFLTKKPERFSELKEQYFQFTLVDCPGHASLLRTIIGGAQIIDMMLLIVDVTKGIQTQTAECIIIAELFLNKIIVVLNKVDLLEDKKQLETKTSALRKAFSKTKFGSEVLMVPMSTKNSPLDHIYKLQEVILENLTIPKRDSTKPFSMLIDHCFKIKGKGNIVTGTVVEGRIKSGEEIQICEIQQKGKIKSIQMFRKPLNSAKQGDRVAMLVTQIESEKIERGLACAPGSIKKVNRFVIDLNMIRLYKRPLKNKAKFHIISGHQTIMGEIRLLYVPDKKIDINKSYLLINEIEEARQLEEKSEEKTDKLLPNNSETGTDQKIEQKNDTDNETQANTESPVFMIVSLEKEMYLSLSSQVVGYKFDVDIEEKMCRIAFHGKIRHIITEDPKTMPKLYKNKQKTGIVDRLQDCYTIIVKDLFDKSFLDIKEFVGKTVEIEGFPEHRGKIEGTFGKSGKVKVIFKNAIEGEVEGKQVRMDYVKWYN